VPALDPAVDAGELGIMLGSVDDRGQDGRPPRRAQQIGDGGQDCPEVAFQGTGVRRRFLAVRHLRAGVYHQR